VKSLIAQLTFFYFIVFQTICMSVDAESSDYVWQIGPIQINPFDIAMLLVYLFIAFTYRKRLLQEEGVNRRILLLIAAYVIYQAIVVLPLSYQSTGLPFKSLLRALIGRTYVLIIPFLYWEVLPSYKTFSRFYAPIALSAVVLFFIGTTKLFAGNTAYTNTGQARALWGGSVLLFASVFIVNYFRTKRNLLNLLLMFAMLIGFILANHRSAYLCFAAVFLTYLFIKGKGSWKMIRNSLIILGAAVGIISQIPTLWDNFIGRVVSSLDTGDENAAGRMIRWFLSFLYFLKNPINGSMLKNEFYSDTDTNPGQYPPHNFIFETLSTQGLTGMLFFVLLIVLVLRTAYRNRNDQYSLQLFLCLLFFLIFSMMNATFFDSWDILMFMVPCAAIMYRNKLALKEHTLLAIDPSLVIA
jgi:O-antigen ligase